ncbi:MAG: response regulator [Magnetococcales bacterium]|nr:response regulator [Magnetococcales bacterium]
MTDGAHRKRILIVDDIPGNIKVLMEILGDGYDISIATSGSTALQIVAKKVPDMILLDIIMPDMDGFELYAKLRTMASLRDVPVIFITAQSEPENETHGLALGAVDFIARPINPAVILARVKTHLALKDAQREALQAAHAKSQYLAYMSHEIRSPLNGILGLVGLLAKRKSQDPKSLQFLELIEQSGQHLLAVVNDILDHSKIEANKVSLENIPFNLRELLAKTLDLFSLSAKEKRIKLGWRCTDAVPAIIFGDPNRLRQVLYNLVANAIKFTKKGRVDLEVGMAGCCEESLTVQFAVRDTGIGIPPDVLNVLFQPFAQADASIARTFGGTGLGLSICASLVRLMGGEIQVESRPGEGSCFSFTATFSRSFVPAEPALANLATPTAAILGDCRILVVDDIETNRVFLGELLATLGIRQVELACDGQEALARLHEQAFDLVLMDCHMPVLNGLEVTRTLRGQEAAGGKGARTPVIALTASITETDRARCFAAGMDDFLAKPVDAQILLQVLHRWLRVTPGPSAVEPTPDLAIRPDLAPESAAGSPLDETAFDAESRIMGKERMDRLVRAFFQDLERNMVALRMAVAAQDAHKIFEVAHALKGCCGAVYATGMTRHCEEMQQVGKTGALGRATPLLEQLEVEHALLRKTLEKKRT